MTREKLAPSNFHLVAHVFDIEESIFASINKYEKTIELQNRLRLYVREISIIKDDRANGKRK